MGRRQLLVMMEENKRNKRRRNNQKPPTNKSIAAPKNSQNRNRSRSSNRRVEIKVASRIHRRKEQLLIFMICRKLISGLARSSGSKRIQTVRSSTTRKSISEMERLERSPVDCKRIFLSRGCRINSVLLS